MPPEKNLSCFAETVNFCAPEQKLFRINFLFVTFNQFCYIFIIKLKGGHMLAIATIIMILFLGLIFAVVFFGIIIYNKLVRLRTTVKSSWSDIDVQLKKI